MTRIDVALFSTALIVVLLESNFLPVVRRFDARRNRPPEPPGR